MYVVNTVIYPQEIRMLPTKAELWESEQKAPCGIAVDKRQRHTNVANRKRRLEKDALGLGRDIEKQKQKPKVLANQLSGGDMWNFYH